MTPSLLRLGCLVLTTALAVGCGPFGREPLRADWKVVEQSPSLQIAKVDPTLKGQRYSVLLNFELSSDDAFVTASGGKVALDARRAQTGTASLFVDNDVRELAIRIDSLLAGRAFPARWTLLGASIYADKAAAAELVLELAGGQVLRQQQALRPAGWNTLWLDLTSLPSDASPSRLVIRIDGKTDVWIDDILLTDNHHFYVGTSDQDEPWSISRKGYAIIVQSPGRYRVSLDTILAKPTGFVVDETTSMRARFSSLGECRELTIYNDGRSFWDGEFRGLSPEARSEGPQQHLSPAVVTVPAEMGRVDRRTAGDANNDGYNERVGAYQIVATTPRIDVTLSPRGAVLSRPVLEIAGLPAGNVLVTVEGRLVDDFVRTPAGALLVRLPFRIDRPTTVNIRVS
ncbi:MAG: hypothetical protein NZ561_10430 [Phycisphaerae bacterium]|nr:hypothetical protein [Phycisphaerae bacterium]MDW8261158.1 hypothetical protein [Phycisphaerales bacterium]